MTTTFAHDPAPPVPDDEDSVPVDQIPEPKVTAFDRITAHREGSKKPVVPTWARDRSERSAIFKWAIGWVWHLTKFHGLRLLFVYPWRIAARSHVGAWRVLRAVAGYLTHAESRELRQEAALHDTKRNEAAYRALKAVQQKELMRRRRIAWLLTIPALAGALVVWFWVPAWAFWLGVGVVVEVLGLVGRDPDVSLISKATTPAHLAPVLRQDAVERALRALPCIKKDAVIEFPDPIIRDGPGWLARVNLPLGVTPINIVDEREALASGLRRPLGCVHPESGSDEHGGLLKLWVGFQDLATARQSPYPLLKGTADIFKKLPYGTDIRGHKIGIDLFQNNVLIGALPGAGKTAAMRALGVGVSLDVTAEIHVWEFSGKGDLSCLEKVAHRYGSGQSDEVFRACLADLEEIRADLEVRAATITRVKKQSPESCPDGMTSRYLADKRNLGLHPVVVFLDEVQNLYSHETHGRDAARLVLHIIRLGRALGVIIIQATQRPDKDSLPTAISANAGIRICLRVMGSAENNMILGANAYGRGIRATTLTKRDKGVGYLVGIDDDSVMAKSYYLSLPEADRITERARALREQAGRLTGYAAGVLDEDDNDSLIYDLLTDVKRVLIEADRDWMHSQEILLGLAELREGHYGSWDQELLAKNLTPLGVKTDQLNRVCPDGVRRNLRGVELSHVVRAIEGRSGSNVVPLRVAPPPATGNTAV